jgi:hypothetical protein
LLDDLGALMDGLCDPALRTSLHGLRGSLAIARQDFAGAQKEYAAALRTAQRSGSAPRVIMSMQNLGAAAADLGQLSPCAPVVREGLRRGRCRRGPG